MRMLKEVDFIAQLKTTLTADLRHDTFFDAKTRMAITQDLLVEGTHFSLQTTSPEELGWKAIAVNLSDLAATAATPLWITVGLACPESTEKTWLEAFYKGMQTCCNTYNCEIVGGDTTRGKALTISICAVGHVPANLAVGRRTGAQVGDTVAIAGPHGLSGLGLIAMEKGIPFQYPKAIQAHLKPTPLITLAQQLAQTSTRETITMMDTSDGLADALIQLAEINHCQIQIDGTKIPLEKELLTYTKHDTANALDTALYGGEDYGLCCILPENIALQHPQLNIIGAVTSLNLDETGLANLQLGNTVKTLDRHKTYQHF